MSVIDAGNGAVLFELERRQVFSAATAEAVRSALELTSLSGTAANALRDLARVSAIASKTGTAGFQHHGHWQGEGGSWCVAADRASGFVIAVRMRWKSGRPFEPEGGRSAAYVVRHFLSEIRSQDSHAAP